MKTKESVLEAMDREELIDMIADLEESNEVCEEELNALSKALEALSTRVARFLEGTS